ncbi:MAG: hypothetical protein ACLFXM_11750 [Acidimicrobiia bacterium]
MLKQRLAAIGALAVVATLAAGCADQSAALRVGGDTYSDDDLRDELDAYAGNDALWGEAGGQSVDAIRGELESSYDQQFVSQILQQRVSFMLGERIFDDEGLELTDDRRESAQEVLEQQFGGALEGFPDSYRERFVEDVARMIALEDELGPEGLNAALIRAAGSTNIDVSSHYGRWDGERNTVVPPEGPAPPPIDAADPTDPFGG